MSITMTRIEKALTILVLDQPFFAVLAMRLQNIESKEIETFATDGTRLFINPDFCATLSDQEIVTVLAHEVLHCALGHIVRMPAGADMKTWNIAADNEVNWQLEEVNKKSGLNPFPWPSCGKILEDRFEGQAAEIIYNTLANEKPKEQKGNQSKQGTSGQKKGKSKSQGQDQAGETKKSFGEIIPVPQDQKEELKQVWERAIVQADKMARERGNIPSAIKELIEEITTTKIDWKSLLRDYLSATAKEDYSFQHANMRYADTDFLLPSLHNEKPGHLVFAIDTSGSISRELLTEYIAEAQRALDELEPEKLTVIYIDAAIQSLREYQPGDKIDLEILGGGGTDFRPVFEAMNKADDMPKVVVYLTDLAGQFPTECPEYQTLWITETKGQAVPFGEVIEV